MTQENLEEMLRRCASLARLSPQPKLTTDLKEVLAHVSELEAVSVEGVAPLLHPFLESLRLREDVHRVGLAPSQALKHAPEQKDGAFAVPAVLKLED